MTAVAHRSQPKTPTEAPGGDPFVGTGLLLLAALFAVIQILAGYVIPILGIPGLLYLGLGIAILRRRSRRLLIAATVLLALHLGTGVPFLVQALSHPESPVSFLSDAFVLILALTVIAGALTGLRGARPDQRRPIAVVAGVASAVAVAVSLVAAAGVDTDAAQPGDIPVEVVRATFPDVEVPAGGVVLWVDNQDLFRHTLIVEGTDIHIELPGATAVRAPIDLAPAVYRYVCDVPGHEAMVGELVVR